VRAAELFWGIFSRHAQAYAARHRQIRSEGRERALELLDARPGERVLDLACGPGNLTARLLAAGASVTGADLAPGMLAVARGAAPGATYARMAMAALALREGAFEAVLCGHGLQFVPDAVQVLREARRVLRPGGRLAASAPATALRGALADLVEPIADRWLPPLPRPAETIDRGLVEDPDRFRRGALEAGFGEARAELVPVSASWASPAAYVELASSWWSMAARMEGLPDEHVRSFQDELRAALEERHGTGPFETTGSDCVMLAMA
jgi:SAM-dependent methyltransferase